MRILDTFCVWLAVFSGLILLGIVSLTFVDVVLRYVFSAPIFGARDVLEMGMVVVISLAFPFTWRMGGHIVVDLIPDYSIAALTIARDLIVRAIGIAMFGLLAWRCWIRADDAVLFNEATNMIELPFSPFFIFLAGASALQTFVLIVESVFLIMRAPIENTITWAKPLEDAPSAD
ncbi:MAG: TRAP transporter small permease [Alphaproteobacteria bacterium]